MDQIKTIDKFKKLSQENQKIILLNYEKMNNLNSFGFYNCLNCNFFSNIENGTILIDNTKVLHTKSDINLKLQSSNNILPRTRDFICPNKDCKAHNKLFTEREAVFYRVDKSFRIAYLCCECYTEWSI